MILMLKTIYLNFKIVVIIPLEQVILRSSRPEVFCKKGALINFTKFTGKHLCQSLFFNKVAGPGLITPF